MRNDTPLSINAVLKPHMYEPNPATIELMARAREAVKRGLTPQEQRSQTIGWIIGGMPPGSVNREELEAEFDRKYGKVSA